MFAPENTLTFSACLFYVLLMLSFSLSVSNVADENKINKALPISVLVVDSIVIFAILLQMFGVKMPNIKDMPLFTFFIVLVLSFILSIQNVTDEHQENKSLSTIVLIVNTLVGLLVAFTIAKRYIK